MKTYTQDDVLKVIRQEIEATSLRQTAKKVGKSAGFLSDVMNGNRKVSESLAVSFGFHREETIKIEFRKIA